MTVPLAVTAIRVSAPPYPVSISHGTGGPATLATTAPPAWWATAWRDVEHPGPAGRLAAPTAWGRSHTATLAAARQATARLFPTCQDYDVVTRDPSVSSPRIVVTA